MIDKRANDIPAALGGIDNGATVMIGGFGGAGSPVELIHGLIDHGATDLTVISNNTGSGEVGLAALIRAGRVVKVICSYPRSANSTVFPDLYRAGKIALELVPQGTLAERIRAGGSGIPAFYTATGVGTELQEGKEVRSFEGRSYLMEHGLSADVALLKARSADVHGNLLYNMTARNFAPIMATAADLTIVQAEEVVEAGSLDPEAIVTPGIFVNRVVHVSQPAHEADLVAAGESYP